MFRVVSVTLHIPDDPGECQRLLADLLCRNDELRQQAETARERADEARRHIDELERVLDQTAAEYDRLQQQHAELAETLALLRRYIFGPRRERRIDDPDQGHLFDIPEFIAEPEPAAPTPAADGAAPPPKAVDSQGRIIEVACWAHARRKFFDALSNAPREANQMLEWIRQLYDIEDRARDFTPAARLELRQRESVPILDRIENDLAVLKERMLPKSALGKAVNYARNQWAALRRYTTDGRLTIDNNVSERTLRLQAIGRRNWSFLGSAETGPRSAVLFTIVAGAKRHRLEPWAYLRDVLLRLSAGETDLESLLPER